jgi:hypothetical protein
MLLLMQQQRSVIQNKQQMMMGQVWAEQAVLMTMMGGHKPTVHRRRI